MVHLLKMMIFHGKPPGHPTTLACCEHRYLDIPGNVAIICKKMHGIPKVKHYALILYQLFVITKREAAIIRAYMQDEV